MDWSHHPKIGKSVLSPYTSQCGWGAGHMGGSGEGEMGWTETIILLMGIQLSPGVSEAVTSTLKPD